MDVNLEKLFLSEKRLQIGYFVALAINKNECLEPLLQQLHSCVLSEKPTPWGPLHISPVAYWLILLTHNNSILASEQEKIKLCKQVLSGIKKKELINVNDSFTSISRSVIQEFKLIEKNHGLDFVTFFQLSVLKNANLQDLSLHVRLYLLAMFLDGKIDSFNASIVSDIDKFFNVQFDQLLFTLPFLMSAPDCNYVSNLLQPKYALAFCCRQNLTKTPTITHSFFTHGHRVYQFLHLYCGKLLSQYASVGDRQQHRHASCSFLLPELYPTIPVQKLVLTIGRNTELLMANWKLKNVTKKQRMMRWKIIHAEVMALLKLALNDELVALLHPVVKQDTKKHRKNIYHSDDNKIKHKLSEINACLTNFSSQNKLDDETATFVPRVGMIILELSNNGVHFCSAQCCPNCIKILIRWGIASQTYSSGDEKLWRTEKITSNPNLQCETLTKILEQAAIDTIGEFVATTEI